MSVNRLAAIHFRGKWYTIAEAGTLATKQRQRGNLQAAVEIYDLVLAKTPDHVIAYQRGVTLENLGKLDDALASYDTAIALKPDNVEAYNNRGFILHGQKRFDEALASYDRALALRPDDALVHNNRGNVLQALARVDEALAEYEKVLALRPDYALAHNNRGHLLQQIKQYDDALASYDKAIALKPDQAEFYCNRGGAWVAKGDMQEAEKMFAQALALEPNHSRAWAELINIRKYRDADDADIKSIKALLDKPGISQTDRESLLFGLGKVHDDCRRFDEAFDYYRKANEICNSAVSYHAGETSRMIENIMAVFSKEFLAGPFAFGSNDRSPLFVVGMPRSGTTLVTSILSNHPSIATAGELQTIKELALKLSGLDKNGATYPEAVKFISPTLAAGMSEDYLRRLRRDAGDKVPHIIDKHPLNFRHLGFISMLFPQSRIIHCTRHPMDTALSNYFQRFSLYYDYSFDLGNIGHFYREYARLMEHWKKVLPLKMIEISYEDMVLHTERIAREALDWLGLDWDERCLAPHTNRAPIETASQWQVRQPIYDRSVGRWRHYENHLGPLKHILPLSGRCDAG